MARTAIRPLPPQRQLTEEQQRENAIKAFMQKRAAVAEGVLFNLCNNPGMTSTAFAQPETISEAAIKITDAFMEKLYTADNA